MAPLDRLSYFSYFEFKPSKEDLPDVSLFGFVVCSGVQRQFGGQKLRWGEKKAPCAVNKQFMLT